MLHKCPACGCGRVNVVFIVNPTRSTPAPSLGRHLADKPDIQPLRQRWADSDWRRRLAVLS